MCACACTIIHVHMVISTRRYIRTRNYVHAYTQAGPTRRGAKQHNVNIHVGPASVPRTSLSCLPSFVVHTRSWLRFSFVRSLLLSFLRFSFSFSLFFFFHLVSIRLRASAFEIEYSLVYVYTYIYVYVCVTASLPVLHSRSSSLSRTSRFLSFFSISMFVGKTLA